MNTNLSCLNWLNNKKEIEFTGSEEFSDCGSNTLYFFEGDEVIRGGYGLCNTSKRVKNM